jgi:hypothetical protein
MNTMQLQEGIRDINLNYLMLAQQMIKENKAAGPGRYVVQPLAYPGNQDGGIQYVAVSFPF